MSNKIVIVIAGFGAVGSFLYFLLRNYNPIVYTRRGSISPYEVSFLHRNKNIITFPIENINLLQNNVKKIDYLFLCSKSYDTKLYLENILRGFEVNNLVLTQNGLFIEDEVIPIFKGKIYYLTLTTGMEFKDNKLLIYNPTKSQAVLTIVSNNSTGTESSDFRLCWDERYCVLSYSYDHLSVRFSKLILNLVLNVVPACFGGLPWEIFPSNPEAIKIERDLIREIIDFMIRQNIKFFNFRSYRLDYISFFYRYCPFVIFKGIYSSPTILKFIRDNRVPSFYRDLILNKNITEVDYYLGWYKKFEQYKMPTVKMVYQQIKKMEQSLKG
ncbi:MAG: hypothetical protein N2657_00765 [bacterium]|nr:hypothetical protein [bacterium]